MTQIATGIQTTEAVYVAKDITPIKERTELSLSDKLERDRIRDREMVRGVFRRHDGSDETLTFSALVHKGDKLTKYGPFVDGGVYTIPRGIKINLNKRCRIPVYGWIPGLNAADPATQVITGYKSRFSFSAMDDIEDYEGPHIIQPVEYRALR